MTQLTADDLLTPEYLTVRELNNTVHIGIQRDLRLIVIKAHSAEILSEDERDDIIDSSTNDPDSRRAIKFMTMLGNKSFKNFWLATFRGILAEASHRRLVDVIGELFSLIHTLHSIKWLDQ